MSNNNYVSKHWRGELGLIISCLLNGGVIGLALFMLPASILYISGIILGIALAIMGLQNPDISDILKAFGFFAFIIFFIAPTIVWTVWSSVGVFRCGTRYASLKTDRLRRLGGFVAILWSVTIGILAIQREHLIIKSLWDSGIINPKSAFLEPSYRAPPQDIERAKFANILGGNSLSTTPVEFSLAGVKYSIPRNYLIVMYDWRGGPQEYVDIRVNLPDLNPMTKETEKCFSNHTYGLIFNSSLHSTPQTPGCLPFQIRLTPPSEVTAEQVFKNTQNLFHNQKPSEGPAGFEKYQSGPDNDPIETYRKIENGRILLYQCIINYFNGQPRGSCHPLEDRTKNGMELDYLFDPDMLGDIVQIDTKLHKLIEGFAVTAN